MSAIALAPATFDFYVVRRLPALEVCNCHTYSDVAFFTSKQLALKRATELQDAEHDETGGYPQFHFHVSGIHVNSK